MSQKHQKHINKYFPNKGILYQPGLSLALGSVNAGILMSQLLYWHEKGRDKNGWVYKTMYELKSETGLSRTQQETAIRVCRDLKIIDYKIAGIPAKRHFKVNMEWLENQLPRLKEKAGVVFLNPPYKFAQNKQTITKTTQKTTAMNTRKNLNSAVSVRDILQNRG